MTDTLNRWLVRTVILVAGTLSPGSALADQEILTYEQFEGYDDGELPTGWTVHRGPRPGDTDCATWYYLEVGLGEEGTSLVLASDTEACAQAIGVRAGPFDIEDCSSLVVSGRYMDLGDESHACPGTWMKTDPPETECLGFSFDGELFILVADFLYYSDFQPLQSSQATDDTFGATELYLYLSQYDDNPPIEFATGDDYDGIAIDDVAVVCDPWEVECGDGEDNDLDLLVDCDDTDCAEGDRDEDGVTPCAGDCDDSNSNVHPNAGEVCDGLDNDCDGEMLPDEVDEDGDAYLPCSGDCDDTQGAIHPDADELCDDGVDNDCDGFVDDEDEACIQAGDDDDTTPADDDDVATDDSGGDCSCSATGLDEGYTATALCLGMLPLLRRYRRHRS